MRYDAQNAGILVVSNCTFILDTYRFTQRHGNRTQRQDHIACAILARCQVPLEHLILCILHFVLDLCRSFFRVFALNARRAQSASFRIEERVSILHRATAFARAVELVVVRFAHVAVVGVDIRLSIAGSIRFTRRDDVARGFGEAACRASLAIARVVVELLHRCELATYRAAAVTPSHAKDYLN